MLTQKPFQLLILYVILSLSNSSTSTSKWMKQFSVNYLRDGKLRRPGEEEYRRLPKPKKDKLNSFNPNTNYVLQGKGATILASGYDKSTVFIQQCEYVNGKLTWTLQTRLKISDIMKEMMKPDELEDYGSWIASSGDILVISDNTHDNENGKDAGAAFIFQRSRSSWTQLQKLLPDDGFAYQKFGQIVTIDKDTAVIGNGQSDSDSFAPASVYIFQGFREQSYWSQQQKLTASDGHPTDRFGSSAISIWGDEIIIGASGANNNNNNNNDYKSNNGLGQGINQGAIYIFKRIQNQWTELQKILPPQPQDYLYFGDVFSRYEDYLVIGSPFEDSVGSSTGAVYIFRAVDTTAMPSSSSVSNINKNYNNDEEGKKKLVQDIPLQDDPLHTPEISEKNNIVPPSSPLEKDHKVDRKPLQSSWMWSQQSKILPHDSTAGSHFGGYVSMFASTLAIGTYADEGMDGSVYLYERKINTNINYNNNNNGDGRDSSGSDPNGVDYTGGDAAIGASVGVGVVNSGKPFVFTTTGHANIDLEMWSIIAEFIPPQPRPSPSSSQQGTERGKQLRAVPSHSHSSNSLTFTSTSTSSHSSSYFMKVKKRPVSNYFKNPVVYGTNLAMTTKDTIEIYSSSWDWSCLIISLGDAFGDGWDDELKLQVQSPDGSVDSYAPSCQSHNPLEIRYCPLSLSSKNSGVYEISLVGVEEAAFLWEASWSIRIEQPWGLREAAKGGDSTAATTSSSAAATATTVYNGDVGKKLRFKFDAILKRFEFVEEEFVLEPGIGRKTADTSSSSLKLNADSNLERICSDFSRHGASRGQSRSHSVTPSPLAPLPAGMRIPSYTHYFKNDDSVSPNGVTSRYQPIRFIFPSIMEPSDVPFNPFDASPITSPFSALPPHTPSGDPLSGAAGGGGGAFGNPFSVNPFSVGYSKPKIPPPPAPPQVLTLTDAGGNSWVKGGNQGTGYYISDVNGYYLYTYGTLCEDKLSDDIPLVLEDGHYLLRVSGDLDDDSGDRSWAFCGQSGGAKEQLEFIVKSGQCFPLVQFTRSSYCNPVVSVLVGHFIFHGQNFQEYLSGSKGFTAGDEKVLNTALTTAIQIPGFRVSHMKIDLEQSSETTLAIAFTAFIPMFEPNLNNIRLLFENNHQSHLYVNFLEISNEVSKELTQSITFQFLNLHLLKSLALRTPDSSTFLEVEDVSLKLIRLAGVDAPPPIGPPRSPRQTKTVTTPLDEMLLNSNGFDASHELLSASSLLGEGGGTASSTMISSGVISEDVDGVMMTSFATESLYLLPSSSNGYSHQYQLQVAAERQRQQAVEEEESEEIQDVMTLRDYVENLSYATILKLATGTIALTVLLILVMFTKFSLPSNGMVIYEDQLLRARKGNTASNTGDVGSSGSSNSSTNSTKSGFMVKPRLLMHRKSPSSPLPTIHSQSSGTTSTEFFQNPLDDTSHGMNVLSLGQFRSNVCNNHSSINNKDDGYSDASPINLASVTYVEHNLTLDTISEISGRHGSVKSGITSTPLLAHHHRHNSYDNASSVSDSNNGSLCDIESSDGVGVGFNSVRRDGIYPDVRILLNSRPGYGVNRSNMVGSSGNGIAAATVTGGGGGVNSVQMKHTAYPPISPTVPLPPTSPTTPVTDITGTTQTLPNAATTVTTLLPVGAAEATSDKPVVEGVAEGRYSESNDVFVPVMSLDTVMLSSVPTELPSATPVTPVSNNVSTLIPGGLSGISLIEAGGFQSGDKPMVEEESVSFVDVNQSSSSGVTQLLSHERPLVVSAEDMKGGSMLGGSLQDMVTMATSTSPPPSDPSSQITSSVLNNQNSTHTNDAKSGDPTKLPSSPSLPQQQPVMESAVVSLTPALPPQLNSNNHNSSTSLHDQKKLSLNLRRRTNATVGSFATTSLTQGTTAGTGLNMSMTGQTTTALYTMSVKHHYETDDHPGSLVGRVLDVADDLESVISDLTDATDGSLEGGGGFDEDALEPHFGLDLDRHHRRSINDRVRYTLNAIDSKAESYGGYRVNQASNNRKTAFGSDDSNMNGYSARVTDAASNL